MNAIFSRGWIVSRALGIGMASQLAAQPVPNGSFEDGFTGWETSGNVTLESLPPYLAAEGHTLAAFNSGNTAPNGSISTILPVNPGQRYKLEFEVGNLSYNQLRQKMRVRVDNFLPFTWEDPPYFEETIEIVGPRGGATAWVSASYPFLANKDGVKITFTDVSPGTVSADLVLDHVRLTAVYDEPLLNGSFENGLTGWNATGNVLVQASPSQTSTNGRKVVAFNANDSVANGKLSQTFPVVPGKKYVLSFDYGYAGLVTRQVELFYQIKDGRGDSVTSNLATMFARPGTAWDTKDVYFEARDAVHTLEITDFSNRYGPSHGIDMLLDHVRLTMVNERPQPPVLNGGFESNFDYWDVGGNVALQNEAPYYATDSRTLASFNSNNSAPNGWVQQTVDTVPGKSYRLKFDVGNLAFTSLHQRMNVRVYSSGPAILQDTIDIAGPGRGLTTWLAKTYVFTAKDFRTAIRFSDVSTGTNASDLLLDQVRLEPVY